MPKWAVPNFAQMFLWIGTILWVQLNSILFSIQKYRIIKNIFVLALYGGIVNLFIGGSILTSFEIIIYILIRKYHNCRKRQPITLQYLHWIIEFKFGIFLLFSASRRSIFFAYFCLTSLYVRISQILDSLFSG